MLTRPDVLPDEAPVAWAEAEAAAGAKPLAWIWCIGPLVYNEIGQLKVASLKPQLCNHRNGWIWLSSSSQNLHSSNGERICKCPQQTKRWGEPKTEN